MYSKHLHVQDLALSTLVASRIEESMHQEVLQDSELKLFCLDRVYKTSIRITSLVSCLSLVP